MGTLISLFVVIGLILVYLEFFVPSGLLGAIAAFLLISSVVIFGVQSSGWGWTVGFAVLVFCFVSITCRLALWKVKRKVSLKNDQQGFQASSYDASLIGKEGVVLTDLKPSGHVMVENKQVQAFSETGYIVKDTPIVVIGGRGGNLIIKKKESI